MRAVILRLGHRYVRDYRVTTHLALVARAFGAEEMLVTDVEDDLKESISEVNDRWGGNFKIKEISNWKREIEEWKKSGIVVHLTMYGLNVDAIIGEIRENCKDVMIVVGAEKVPKEVYHLCNYNVAIGNQPHSEIAALAIFLDRLFNGKQFTLDFKGRMRIVPSTKGKIVERS